MKIKNARGFVCFLFLLVFSLGGCSSKKSSDDIISTDDMTLIYEETISPNKEYVEKEEDIVTYTVEIYQNEDDKILVNSKSNSKFFEPLQYEVECNTSIAKSDIEVEWTTLMGNPNQTEDDQLSTACVSISENGTLLDKRKISFVNRAIDIIGDVIDKN
ncbi:hypothetical protein H8S37_02560 [Mediterraneibacter sp. NSJ-55]|uniref:Uncharacterized protein n=1 Tax=Mediterraneibacter hominis TaxID=2763054 RepID=A0A923LFP0_9FIRM|nr:hypothetical protein [Mediterraneibacter hominis]MBC5687820.1 hypothetical protein [Mediterraneibacter hominis]